MKLTKPQTREIIRICSTHADATKPFPHAGWFNTVPERKLEEMGLIKHWVERKPFGGGGAIGGIMMTLNFCDLTDEGWLVCRDILAT